MRYCICFALCVLISGSIKAQVDRGNKYPRIVGQNQVITNEDQPVRIQLGDLIVNDQDDWFYPWGFTLKVYEGNNYTLSNNTVIPVTNFYGTLLVPVTVNDGEDDSKKYDLQVTVTGVNDPPLIIAQSGPITIEASQSFQVQFSHLLVSDADNIYPTGFTLALLPPNSNTYSVSGNQVTPSPGFSGTLSVPVQVNDGSAASNSYAMNIEVKPGNKPPVITGQALLDINEDETLLIQLAHLIVSDPDNTYPIGFRLTIIPGEMYTVSNTTITPARDFYGDLSVKVAVHDGTSESSPFAMKVRVLPENDAPEIVRLEKEALRYTIGKGPASITKEFEVSDADNDSLTQAEIGFLAEQYRFGSDELSFTATSGIKGTFDYQRGSLVLSGRAPVNQYIQCVRSVKYNYVVAGDPLKETKTLFFRLSDGKAMSEVKQRQILVTDVVVKLDIPTAFTPNGDAANDTWRIQPVKQQDEKMDIMIRVYNRSGRLLFETAGFEREWDGRFNGELLPADTYYYTIDFNEEYSRNSVKGIVAILR